MFFTANNGADTPQVTTSGDHTQIAGLKLDTVGNFAGTNVQLDGVIDFDQWIRKTDGATVVRNQVGDLLGSDTGFLDLAQLVLKAK